MKDCWTDYFPTAEPSVCSLPSPLTDARYTVFVCLLCSWTDYLLECSWNMSLPYLLGDMVWIRDRADKKCNARPDSGRSSHIDDSAWDKILQPLHPSTAFSELPWSLSSSSQSAGPEAKGWLVICLHLFWKPVDINSILRIRIPLDLRTCFYTSMCVCTCV